MRGLLDSLLEIRFADAIDILLVTSLVYAGYLFGNIPWVKSTLTLIVIGIVVVSLIPAFTTYLQERARSRRA